MSDSILTQLFHVKKPIIGNIHCLALPGSPDYEKGGMERAIRQAVEEAVILEENGLDGVIIENAGDIPYMRPENIGFETVAALTTVAVEVSKAIKIPYGIICLGNGAIQSMAIAAATNAAFIRVNQFAHAYVGIEGLMNGQAPETMRYRTFLQAKQVKVFADVHVKFGAHTISSDRSIPELARDVEEFGAEVLIATGTRTGDPTSVEEVRTIKSGTHKEVIVGSGLNADNAPALMTVADGAIVGAWFKEGGQWRGRLLPEQVAKLARVMQIIRAENG